MSLVRSFLRPSSIRVMAGYSMDDYIGWLAQAGFPLLNQSWSTTEERVEGDFAGLVRTAYQANGIVFACLMTRFLLFAEARFQYQQMRRSRPGDLFGTPELGIVERPEPGQTTGDMLSLALLDADLSGDWFGIRRPGRIKRLRPDWTIILVGSANKETEYPGADPDAEIVGFAYSPIGQFNTGEVWTFLPNEIAHFAPIKDPLARYRGMPLPTAALREIAADSAATTHKRKFFENAATPNLIVRFPPTMDATKAQKLIDVFEQNHVGALNAYRTMYLLGGAEATSVGANMQQLEFKATQGAGETRIAAALNVHPAIAALSEGMAGANLNEGNFKAARRLQADKMLRPNWRIFAGSLESIVPPLPGTRLWYDDRDIPFLAEDIKDRTEVLSQEASMIVSLGNAGWDQDTVIDAVTAGDLRRLSGAHTGLTSVQLQPPSGAEPPVAMAARTTFWPSSGRYADLSIERGTLVRLDDPLVRAFPSLFAPVGESDPRIRDARAAGVHWQLPVTGAPILVPSTNGGHAR